MIAIGSGKGGVGKSTLTMQLAESPSSPRGARVAILDADLNGPSQARLGGPARCAVAPRRARRSCRRRRRAGSASSRWARSCPSRRRLDFDSVARGDSYVWRATREFAAFGDLLAGVGWGELDFLLVDLPPGAERTVAVRRVSRRGGAPSCWSRSRPTLSRGVVPRAIAAMRKTPNRMLGYVENMSGYLLRRLRRRCSRSSRARRRSTWACRVSARCRSIPSSPPPAIAASPSRDRARPAVTWRARRDRRRALASLGGATMKFLCVLCDQADEARRDGAARSRRARDRLRVPRVRAPGGDADQPARDPDRARRSASRSDRRQGDDREVPVLAAWSRR